MYSNILNLARDAHIRGGIITAILVPAIVLLILLNVRCVCVCEIPARINLSHLSSFLSMCPLPMMRISLFAVHTISGAHVVAFLRFSSSSKCDF